MALRFNAVDELAPRKMDGLIDCLLTEVRLVMMNGSMSLEQYLSYVGSQGKGKEKLYLPFNPRYRALRAATFLRQIP